MLVIEPRAAELGATIRYTILDDVQVLPSGEAIQGRIGGIVDEFRMRIGDASKLSSHPHISAYRRMFWSMKVDPTKMRPSPEALARRVLRDGFLPLINNIVDAGNAASLSRLVSIGLYDMEKIATPLRLRTLEGGIFEPIGGKPIQAPKGFIGLVDSKGRILHLYAHRDSKVSMITHETRKVLAIAYGAPGIPEEELGGALSLFLEILSAEAMDDYTPRY